MDVSGAEERSILSDAGRRLRLIGMRWAVAGMLPLPVLVITDPAGSGPVGCLYLGMACAWLSTEIHRCDDQPGSLDAWIAKTIAVCIACAANVACLVPVGVAVGVQTQFPFAGMAALSAVPAIGLVPFLMRKTREPFAAIILAGVLLLAAKLAGCVVARIVYGPSFDKAGRIAADWGTAKLMISVFWMLCAALSLVALLADYVYRRSVPASERTTAQNHA